MKFKSWNGKKFIELMECPFCGGQADIFHIGNDFTKTRKIKIKCNRCRIERTDAAIRLNMEQLEEIAVKNWNKRK